MDCLTMMHSLNPKYFSLQINNGEPNYTGNNNYKNNIAEFQLQLSLELWDDIFGE